MDAKNVRTMLKREFPAIKGVSLRSRKSGNYLVITFRQDMDAHERHFLRFDGYTTLLRIRDLLNKYFPDSHITSGGGHRGTIKIQALEL